MERQNDMEELSVNISYCPYCGSKNIIRINDVIVHVMTADVIIWS